MTLDEISDAIAADRLRITAHADEEMAADGLTLDVVLGAVRIGEIIEEYPDDYPLPSCLILGFSESSEAIHSVWAYNGNTELAILVTVYRPDPNRWTNWRVRK